MQLHLLLTHADDHRPVLPNGLALASVQREPLPPVLAKPKHLYEHHGDKNDLAAQGWGIVVPKGKRGAQLLERIAPLRQLRAEQQNLKPEEVKVFEVEPGMSAIEAEAFRTRLLQIPLEEQPRYLLLLGDAHEVSFELQQHLAVDRFVGRLAFARDADFDAYVNKVLRAEREVPRAERARALFFTVHDRTVATDLGYKKLISPSIQGCQHSKQRGKFPASEVREIGTPLDWTAHHFLTQAAEPTPSVMLTLSHGYGAPYGGWQSSVNQRQYQGSMDMGLETPLRVDDVAGRPFLPNGLWLSFSCFSAGTPARSTYAPWLQRLEETGEGRGLESVRSSAPVDGRSFVAALPQAALANPDGPLAIIGHVDLAWTYSFYEPDGQTHANRFAAVLKAWVSHSRAGVGLNVLSSAVATVNERLTMLYQRDAVTRFEGQEPLPEELNRAHLWMVRHDLSGYVLLGDPAVRLPIQEHSRR